MIIAKRRWQKAAHTLTCRPLERPKSDDKLLDRIGLLTPEQGPAVVHAYHAASTSFQTCAGFETVSDQNGDAPVGDPGQGYVRLRPCNFADARKLHRDRIKLLDDAISALKKS